MWNTAWGGGDSYLVTSKKRHINLILGITALSQITAETTKITPSQFVPTRWLPSSQKEKRHKNKTEKKKIAFSAYNYIQNRLHLCTCMVEKLATSSQVKSTQRGANIDPKLWISNTCSYCYLYASTPYAHSDVECKCLKCHHFMLTPLTRPEKSANTQVFADISDIIPQTFQSNQMLFPESIFSEKHQEDSV